MLAEFVSGIVASVAANVMHAQLVSRPAWIGAAFWPVALMLAVDGLMVVAATALLATSRTRE